MLLHAHSGFRYLALLVGIMVIAYAVSGMVTERAYDQRMRVLAAAFMGFVDVTILLGFAIVFTARVRPTGLGAHIVMALLATTVSHIVYSVQKRRPPAERTYPPHIVGTLIVLALIAWGLVAIGRPVVG